MIGYAQVEGCRRAFILRYFGDHSPADAPACCDNCLARQEREVVQISGSVKASPPAKPIADMTQAERAALIVLDTLAHLPYDVGKGKLAQVLKGSSSQEVSSLTGSRHFGKFAELRLSEIESLIEQLALAGYVAIGGGVRPTLKLTPNGKTALEQRRAIQVQLRPVRLAIAGQKRAGAMTDTMGLTEQLLKQGCSPQQIAAERGLTVGTIYSHLGQLIALRRVSVNDVIPARVQTLVREAIERVGSVDYLAPIKAKLPEEIEYGVIRCVAEAWKIERGVAPEKPPPSAASDPDRAAYVHNLGESGDTRAVPELIVALNDNNGNVRRLAASALGKLKAKDAVQALLDLLANEPGPQVRQYAIKALGTIGDPRAQAMLQRIENDAMEKSYNREAARVALSTIERNTRIQHR
jgi:hypothetical protein